MDSLVAVELLNSLCFPLLVQVNGTKLSLDAPLQLHGVELSKDQTGVTAKMKLSSYNTSVFFDGYTAQIYLTGMTNLLHALEGGGSFPL